MEAVHEDGGEGGMQCARHPFKNSTPAGGICASCLQEKLGKLVSSSYAVAVFPSSSSSSPSSRSTYAATAADARLASSAASGHHQSRKSRLPFISKKKSKEERSSEMVFKRSKSTATPRRGIHFFDDKYVQDYNTPNKRRFWKFLHLSKHPTSRKSEKHVKNLNFSSPTTAESREGERKREEFVVVDDNEATFDRKVSRSRSVGCGSRSFSGDFFERISTGFGHCTLRRVESQREGKPKMQSGCSRQRVRCGGIFGGFGLTSSSSSSHLIAASDSSVGGGKSMVGFGHLSHGRSKSWGWALASPMRAFGKNSAVKRGDVSAKNAAPNLDAIPSLLAVSG